MRGAPALTWVVVAGVLVLLAVGGTVQKKQAKAPKAVDADLSKLQPRFAAKVRALLARMQARGFAAKVHEAVRSEARAAQLDAAGTGIARSMHVKRLAVDIVEDDATPWNAAPGFFEALHEEALALGLARVKHKGPDGVLRWDLPHVQALPGSMDAKAWAMSDTQLDALLAQHYG